MTGSVIVVAIGVLVVAGLLVARLLRRRGAGVPTHAPDLRPELDRARRYGHVFTLVRLPASAAPSLVDVSARLRSTDRAWLDASDLYVFVPELAGDAVERLIGRLVDSGAVPHRDDVATASFPADGLTLMALFAQLASRRTVRERADQEDQETDTVIARSAS